MTSATAIPARRRARWLLPLACVVVLVVTLYAGWAGYLALAAGEGEVPPGFRSPDVPAGARVVGETTPCASGGCWRELVLRPAPGQSPDELAGQMEVTTEQRHPWHLLDPRSVAVGSRVAGDELVVHVRY